MKLYVKRWCPWCIAAQKVLDQRGYQYELIDVEADRALYDEMRRISGQSLTPTLQVDGKVLPDFGPEELLSFLEKYQIEP